MTTVHIKEMCQCPFKINTIIIPTLATYKHQKTRQPSISSTTTNTHHQITYSLQWLADVSATTRFSERRPQTGRTFVLHSAVILCYIYANKFTDRSTSLFTIYAISIYKHLLASMNIEFGYVREFLQNFLLGDPPAQPGATPINCTARSLFFTERVVNIWNSSSLPYLLTVDTDFSSLSRFIQQINSMDFLKFRCFTCSG